MDKSATDVPECRRKVASRRRVAGGIRFLVNARGLKFDVWGAASGIAHACSVVLQ